MGAQISLRLCLAEHDLHGLFAAQRASAQCPLARIVAATSSVPHRHARKPARRKDTPDDQD